MESFALQPQVAVSDLAESLSLSVSSHIHRACFPLVDAHLAMENQPCIWVSKGFVKDVAVNTRSGSSDPINEQNRQSLLERERPVSNGSLGTN